MKSVLWIDLLSELQEYVNENWQKHVQEVQEAKKDADFNNLATEYFDE